MTTTDPQSQADEHTLPGWVEFVQAHLFLSFLILAEAYLLGTLMAEGWVSNLQRPDQWGVYGGVGVVLFFLSGAMAAGIALKCSVKAAGCFSRHEWGMALFNFVGVLVFAGCEIWASLSERSANLRPTPADSAVLSLIGWGHAPVSPTVVIIALLLPFSSLYYGFSQQHRRDTDVDRAAKAAQEDYDLERKQRRAEANARLRAAQVAGWAGAAKAGVSALIDRQDDTPTSDEDPDPSDGKDADTTQGNAGVSSQETAGSFGETSDLSDREPVAFVANFDDAKTRQAQRRATNLATAKIWTAGDLSTYIQSEYGEEMSEREAKSVIRNLPEATRVLGIQGQPYGAPRVAVKAWAAKRFKAVNVTPLHSERA